MKKLGKEGKMICPIRREPGREKRNDPPTPSESPPEYRASQCTNKCTFRDQGRPHGWSSIPLLGWTVNRKLAGGNLHPTFPLLH